MVVMRLSRVAGVFASLIRIRAKTHYSRREYVALLILCAVGIGAFFGWALT